MPTLTELLQRNHAWADRLRAQDPQFFERLSQQQAPKYLWIGCSDSRVPANQIVDMAPGEVFVHRNVANVVVHGDLNCLSVIQFAVDVLKVEHVMVVGHYGCGGVTAAINGTRVGLADNWLRHVADVGEKYQDMLASIDSNSARISRLCELNAIEQALNVCHTTVIRDAWDRGQNLAVHAWVYGLHDGRVHDLRFDVESQGALTMCYQRALAGLSDGE